MNIYKKTYLAPVAEVVVLEEKDDLLGGDIQIGSVVQGGSDDEAGAKPTGAVEFYNEIWDPKVVSETE